MTTQREIAPFLHCSPGHLGLCPSKNEHRGTLRQYFSAFFPDSHKLPSTKCRGFNLSLGGKGIPELGGGGGRRQVIYTVLRSFSQRCLPAACSHPPPLRLKHYCATGVHLEHGGEGERHQYAQGSEERGQRLNYLFLLSLLIFLRAGGNLARISTINKL